MHGPSTGPGNGGWEHNDGPVQAHLNLQITLRSTVVGARARRGRRESVGHRIARRSFLR